MSDHKHPPYMAIFGTLAGLTAVELAAATMMKGPDVKALLIIILVTLAFIKAGLVGAYFMHLRFEKKTFVAIVCFPLLLALVLVFALFPDVAWKLGGIHHTQPVHSEAAAHPAGEH